MEGFNNPYKQEPVNKAEYGDLPEGMSHPTPEEFEAMMAPLIKENFAAETTGEKSMEQIAEQLVEKYFGSIDDAKLFAHRVRKVIDMIYTVAGRELSGREKSLAVLNKIKQMIVDHPQRDTIKRKLEEEGDDILEPEIERLENIIKELRSNLE